MQKLPQSFDIDHFVADIDALRKALKKSVGSEDLAYFLKIEKIVWGLAIVGLLTAAVTVNALSILALAAASFAHWTIVTHHISHRGYERIPNAPKRFKSASYARGWRRWVQWLDWIDPAAWHHEHDVLHHFNLGEKSDPDVPQNRANGMLEVGLPLPIRLLVVVLTPFVWKPLYYAPNTLNSLLNKEEKTDIDYGSLELWSPLKKRFWQVVWRCWLPYSFGRFVALPGLFLVVSPEAAMNVLISLVIAELISNLWSYWVIVPNHAGTDIYIFEDHPENRGQFYLHQILGTVNYRCGGNINDFMHGWLNYQIEHHLFPDLPVTQYQRAHPKIKEICAKHGVPMICESVFTRNVKLAKILLCIDRQPVWSGELMVESTKAA